MSLSVEWMKHISDPKKKQDFEAVLRNSTVVIARLRSLCAEWENELNTQEMKISDYDTPNWAEKQAHRNGDRSRLRKLRDLLASLD